MSHRLPWLPICERCGRGADEKCLDRDLGPGALPACGCGCWTTGDLAAIYFRRVGERYEMKVPYELAYLTAFLAGAERVWDPIRRITTVNWLGYVAIAQRAWKAGAALEDVTGIKEHLLEQVHHG